MSNVLMFNQASKRWQEGCLLGNGRMGQVIYGDLQKTYIDLSHLTFFSGSDRINPYRPQAPEAFQKARQAAVQGDYEEMVRWVEAFMGKRGNYGTNLPAGRLAVELINGADTEYSDYKSSLDLDRGVFHANCKKNAAEMSVEAFSSHPDHVFVYRIDCRDGMLNAAISYDGVNLPYEVYVKDGVLYFKARALESMHSDGIDGVSLWGSVCVKAEGGYITEKADRIEIIGAKQVIIWLAMETDFGRNESVTDEEMSREVRRQTDYDIADYDRLKKRHTDDVWSFMGRQRMSLNSCEEDRSYTVQQLLASVKNGGDNRRLTELMYQYGRYLLFSSSREDSPLPTSLQGVWNDNVACRIGWTCDIHLDINTQMNYWISEPGNLAECHKPLFDWMENILIPHGRESAKNCYGMPGWIGEIVSNAWGYAAPYWNPALAPCPTGGIWQASDYMEHYRYGLDKEFLRERAYPVLDEAVDFFLAYLFYDGDKLCCGPAISPENAFVVEGKHYFTSVNCTYEVLMIRELFDEYIEMCRELELPETEKEQRVKDALDKLLPYRILEDGTLAEWAHDYAAADSQHRHTSHLLGLFPYSQITPDKTPELAQAAAMSIKKKLTPYEKWEDTGWARTMLGMYTARLRDAEQAYMHAKSMQTVLTGQNLLVMHPPTRGAGSFMEVYELDGNTGFSMVILEMLVQSHDGVIRVLPALPKAWPDGTLTGVKARGGVTVDLSWKNGKVVSVSLYSERDTEVKLIWNDKNMVVKLCAEQPKTMEVEE